MFINIRPKGGNGWFEVLFSLKAKKLYSKDNFPLHKLFDHSKNVVI